MRIIIAYRYFWPDTSPYAIMLRDIAAWLAEAGHEVTVLTAQPAYKPAAGVPRQPARETMLGYEVRRLPLLPEAGRTLVKALNAALFVAMSSLIVLFGRKPDIVWTATMPPVLQALALRFVGSMRGAKFIYHMQDIHPEIAVHSHISREGFVTRLLKRLDTYTLKRTARAMVLSTDMREAILARGVPDHVPHVVRNFALGINAAVEPASPPKPDEAVRFVFAGNIGRFQNLEALVDAFGALRDKGVLLDLVGDGRVKAQLQEQVRNSAYTNIRFHDHMSADDAYAFMCRSHVGVISLNKELYRYAFPSKLLTYMAANLPMFAMVEEHSALARLLKDRTIGLAVSWDRSPAEFSQAIMDVAAMARQGDMHPWACTDYYLPENAKAAYLNVVAEVGRLP
jgi:colanic acid biosynthesis glycosyl transferase WcaI